MKKLIVVLSVVLLSGCALTDVLTSTFKDWQDTNRYEQARETASNVCNPDVLDRLDKFLGADAVAVMRKKCADKRIDPQPLN